MDREALIQRLQGFEWKDFEVKEALRDVPKAVYETVSAFSNTSGGWLVFGVRQSAETFEILGVIEVDKVQNSFLSTLRSGQKLSRIIAPRESVFDHEGKPVLVFYIPESQRSDKPIYLDGNPSRSFVRRGGANHRCSDEELRRFLRDAAEERYDSTPVDEDVASCFDAESLRWYRAEFARQRLGELDGVSDLDFLSHWGLLSERDGSRRPTRAAVLLFGSQGAVNRLLPRPVVDFQVVPTGFEEERGDERWSDRAVVEDNIIKAWRTLLERFRAHAEAKFTVDPGTMQRQDRPPDYVAFREAAINLLAHQDYGDHARKASIRFFSDRTVFSNPGDAFASAEQLLDAGEREVRNPRIIAALRRVGLSEQAGTGIREIFRSWRRLGRVPPILGNDKASKSFELALPREALVGEQQTLLQAQLGVRLDEDEAAVFALAFRRQSLTMLDVRAATGKSATEASALTGRLVTQVLLEPLGDAGPWKLATHIEEQLRASPKPAATDQAQAPSRDLVTDQAAGPGENLVTDQVPTAPRLLLELTDTQRRILEHCEAPRTMAELMEHIGLSHRTHFRRQHLDPLLEARLLRLRYPDSPRHPQQGYLVTDAGLALLTKRPRGGHE